MAQVNPSLSTTMEGPADPLMPTKADAELCGVQPLDFTLPDQDGRPVSLSALRGYIVALYFYENDADPLVQKGALAFKNSVNDMAALGGMTVWIGPNSVESHKAFQQAGGLPFPILSDPEKSVAKAFHVVGADGSVLRSTVLIDKFGRILKVFRDIPPERVATNPLEALTYVQNYLAGAAIAASATSTMGIGADPSLMDTDPALMGADPTLT